MSLIQNKTGGFENQGVITAVPTTVVTPEKDIYTFYVDTALGDIDLTPIAAIPGIMEGATVHFIKSTDDSNTIAFTDPVTGRTVTGCLEHDTLSLTWDATNTRFVLVG